MSLPRPHRRAIRGGHQRLPTSTLLGNLPSLWHRETCVARVFPVGAGRPELGLLLPTPAYASLRRTLTAFGDAFLECGCRSTEAVRRLEEAADAIVADLRLLDPTRGQAARVDLFDATREPGICPFVFAWFPDDEGAAVPRPDDLPPRSLRAARRPDE